MMTGREQEYWFKPRRFGYGARPIHWKGWASAFAYMVVLLSLFFVISVRGTAPYRRPCSQSGWPWLL